MTATTAIVFVNTGSPDAPTEAAVRVYLKEFLSDPRVIELPRWFWLPILNGIVLPIRSSKSAARYAGIWTEDGSPLIVHCRNVVQAVRERLSDLEDVRVELAMRVGNPSIDSVVSMLVEEGVKRIIFLPMFAQYATQTTESILDAVKATMARFGDKAPIWTSIPAYFDEALFIDGLAKHYQRKRGESRYHLVMSFHGIPAKCSERGDPYESQCQATARALAQAMGLAEGEWSMAYQSRFGSDRWLQPYLPGHVERLAKKGITAIDVVCLSFATDCLETLEEIADELQTTFKVAGGRDFRYLPCLNDATEAIDLYEHLIRPQLPK